MESRRATRKPVEDLDLGESRNTDALPSVQGGSRRAVIVSRLRIPMFGRHYNMVIRVDDPPMNNGGPVASCALCHCQSCRVTDTQGYRFIMDQPRIHLPRQFPPEVYANTRVHVRQTNPDLECDFFQ